MKKLIILCLLTIYNLDIINASVLDPCTSSSFLTVLYIIRLLINMIFIIIPVALIISLMIKLLTALVKNESNDIGKLFGEMVTKIVLAVCAFLVPTIATLILELIDVDVEYLDCYYNASIEIIEQLKLQESEIAEQKKEEAYNDFIQNNTHSTKSSLSYIYYNQGNDRWGSQPFCLGGKTIKSSGCGMVSLAMVMANLTNDENINPENFGEWMCDAGHKNNGNDGGGIGTSWLNGSNFKKINNEFISQFTNDRIKAETLFTSGKNHNQKVEEIKRVLSEGKQIIALVPGHYVVLSTVSDCDGIYLFDPASTNKTTCYEDPDKLFLNQKGEYGILYDYNQKCSNPKGNNEPSCGLRGAWAYSIE